MALQQTRRDGCVVYVLTARRRAQTETPYQDENTKAEEDRVGEKRCCWRSSAVQKG